ncbi:MAG: hypothetical protein RR404_04515, partial [Bacilli bacterium]
YLASTTGNITGIYDMSGGAWEYVMGVLSNSSGIPYSGRNNIYNSGFNGPFGCPTCENQTIPSLTGGTAFPTEAKYYDKYTVAGMSGRILGDATGELGPFGLYDNNKYWASSWNKDMANFIYNGAPWFVRGGYYNYGSGSGVFGFTGNCGDADSHIAFRLALTPKI